MNHLRVITAPPGTNELVTLSEARDFPRGTLLIVPPGYVAHFLLNGLWVGDYQAGEYELYSTLSPFFPRLQTFATGGIPPLDARVYFVNTQQQTKVSSATGEFIVKMSDYIFNISGEITLYIRVRDAKRIISTISDWASINAENFEQYISAIVRENAQSALARLVGSLDFWDLSRASDSLSISLSRSLAPAVEALGAELCSLKVTDLRPRENELALHQELSESRLRNRVRIENTRDEIDTLYGGDIDRRVLAETMLRSAENTGNGSMATLPIMWRLGEQLADSFSPQRRVHGGTAPRRPIHSDNDNS